MTKENQGKKRDMEAKGCRGAGTSSGRHAQTYDTRVQGGASSGRHAQREFPADDGSNTRVWRVVSPREPAQPESWTIEAHASRAVLAWRLR